jgi:hypothetical protein
VCSFFHAEKKYFQTDDFAGMNVVEEDLCGNGIFDLNNQPQSLGEGYFPGSFLHPQLSFQPSVIQTVRDADFA